MSIEEASHPLAESVDGKIPPKRSRAIAQTFIWTMNNAEFEEDMFCIHIFTMYPPSLCFRLTANGQIFPDWCSCDKGDCFCVESPEVVNGTTSRIINHAVPRLWAYTTQGRVAMKGVGAVGPRGTWTLAPGAPMDSNEEVPHICSYQVTNQIMLIGWDNTRDGSIHLVPLTSIVSLQGHRWFGDK